MSDELAVAVEALDRIVGRLVMRGDPAGNEAFQSLRVVQKFAASLASSGEATDTERMNALEQWLGDGTEGTEDENVSLWRDFEVPEGCSPSFAVSGFWPGNTRGDSLRKAIDAARLHQEKPTND